MKYRELVEVKKALDVLSGERFTDSAVVYGLAKNLTLAKRLLHEADETRAKLYQDVTDKDEVGNAKVYESNACPACKRPKESVLKIGNKQGLKVYTDAIKAADADEIEFKAHKVLRAPIDEYIKENGLGFGSIAPLLDVVIVERLEAS